MSGLVMWHVAAVSFWFGVVGAEFVVERSRADSRPHGYSVARNHYWIDVLLEVPVALVVLVTGVMLLQVTPVTPWFLIKILAGLLAVAVNVVCLVPVIKRKAAADEERLSDVIRYSAVIDRITVVGLPAALIALMIGLLH